MTSSSMAETTGQYGSISGTVPSVATADIPLQFQESSLPTSSLTGKIAQPSQSSSGDDTFSTPLGAGQSATRAIPDPPTGRFAFFSVSYYRPYFDVDTADVVARIKDTLYPFPRSNFLEKTALNPDMYGPFWICTTLVFLTAVLGNVSSYLSHSSESGGEGVVPGVDDAWHYDISAVSFAACIFYGYCGLVPLALFFLLRYLQVSAGLIQLWCLYGYSVFVFVPTLFLVVIPLELVRWIVVIGATAMSATFLGVNLRAHITEGHELWFPIVAAAIALQGLLGLVLKLYFFTYF